MIRLILFISVFFVFASGNLIAQGGEPQLADQYFQAGEFDKALELYEKLAKKESGEKLFVYRASTCYINLGLYTDGISFLDKMIKRNTDDFTFVILQADLFKLSGDEKKSTELNQNLIYKSLVSKADFMQAGTYYYQRNHKELALETYLQGRKLLKSKYIFSSEIAHLYAVSGKYGLAAQEYINHYYDDPSYINGIKVEILNLVFPESKGEVEQVLLAEVQKNSGDMGIRQILFEFYVLSEDFYEAFVQVKSIDKVFKQSGEEVFKYALTLRNNKNYVLSNQALDFIIENHPRSGYFFSSHQEKTVNSEMMAFEKIPLDTNDIRVAVNAYDDLLDEFGRKPSFFKAMYRKANLMAFYLNDLDEALKEMENLNGIPLNNEEKAKSGLLIGDIYLMQKKYMLAEAKYDEVVELFKEGQIGALGKFKQGRLYYFKGDFEFSQARLSSIKDNTSNDISNDAIRLYLLIQDNTGLDSTTTALEKFAQAQLLVFQRDYDVALELLDSILFEFPNHPLTDEILWEKANIYLVRNDIDKALVFLDKIITGFPTDIIGDDALYTKARIFDFTLNNKEKAMELYIQFLRDYSGSLFAVDVRKRIRELRKG